MRIPLLLAISTLATPVHAAPFEWNAYGGDGRGQRHVPIAEMTPKNVERLDVAWTFRTGELGQGFDRAADALTFETTPLFIDGTLYFATATGKVFALDAEHGTERWRFDAAIDRGRDYSEMTSRGVSFWRDANASADTACAQRIVFATIRRKPPRPRDRSARHIGLDHFRHDPDAGGATYILTAKGLDSGLTSQATFTDSTSIQSVTLNGGSSVRKSRR